VVADLARDIAGQGAFAFASLAPTRRLILAGHLPSDLGGVVSVLAPDLVDLPIGLRAPSAAAEAPASPGATGPSGRHARQVTVLVAGSQVASAPFERAIPHDVQVAG
jgi:hypothetical protein